ncbi:Fur family transcriptional regulator [Cetobacterium sp. SF1]|uniref:Fur family transcriptional regulator n=2 Tax=unclassified Cetobacterium TaxID=2630983 RepID=UPI003CF98D2E
MRFSKQREMILEFIINTDNHHTAEDIYASLKKDHPELSLGTVYRNLGKLAEIGAIRKVSLPNEIDRFDKNLEPHGHLICSSCGKIVDINLKNIHGYLEGIEKDDDVLIHSANVTFHGLCSHCKKK